MGRKQKLREEKKRKIRDDPPPSAAVMATATATAKEKTISMALPTGFDHQDYLIYLDREFPVSVEYAEVVANIKNIEDREIFELCRQGYKEHYCVHSIHGMGKFMLMDGPVRYAFAISYL
jgi:hypothetical protein